MVGRRRPTSYHRTAMLYLAAKTRSEFVHEVELQLHGRAPMEAVHVVSMINADLVAISHVIGSLQLARVFHEAVTFTTREALARDMWRVMKM
jgi:hypothetical protein